MITCRCSSLGFLIRLNNNLVNANLSVLEGCWEMATNIMGINSCYAIRLGLALGGEAADQINVYRNNMFDSATVKST